MKQTDAFAWQLQTTSFALPPIAKRFIFLML